MIWTLAWCEHSFFVATSVFQQWTQWFGIFSIVFRQYFCKRWNSTHRWLPCSDFPFSWLVLLSLAQMLNLANISLQIFNMLPKMPINVECHNRYSISFVCWIRSIRTMRRLCRDLLAISVKRSPFTEYRFVHSCVRNACMLGACVCIRVLRTFDYKYDGIWKSNFQFVCREFGSTMNAHTRSLCLCHYKWHTTYMLTEHWCLANSHGQHSSNAVAILLNEKSTSTAMRRSIFNLHSVASIQ